MLCESWRPVNEDLFGQITRIQVSFMWFETGIHTIVLCAVFSVWIACTEEISIILWCIHNCSVFLIVKEHAMCLQLLKHAKCFSFMLRYACLVGYVCVVREGTSTSRVPLYTVRPDRKYMYRLYMVCPEELSITNTYYGHCTW